MWEETKVPINTVLTKKTTSQEPDIVKEDINTDTKIVK